MTLLIGDRYDLGPAFLSGHLGAGLGGGDHLDLVAVGGGQGHLAVGLAAHVQSSLAHLHKILDQMSINDDATYCYSRCYNDLSLAGSRRAHTQW